jgi:hypothetical protein
MKEVAKKVVRVAKDEEAWRANQPMVEGKGFDAGRESSKRILVKGHQGDLKDNPREDLKCMMKSKPTR